MVCVNFCMWKGAVVQAMHATMDEDDFKENIVCIDCTEFHTFRSRALTFDTSENYAAI